jgi:hypothetical protein
MIARPGPLAQAATATPSYNSPCAQSSFLNARATCPCALSLLSSVPFMLCAVQHKAIAKMCHVGQQWANLRQTYRYHEHPHAMHLDLHFS